MRLRSVVLKTAPLVLLALIAHPRAHAQFAVTQQGPLSGNCPSGPSFGINVYTGHVYSCVNPRKWFKLAPSPIQGVGAPTATCNMSLDGDFAIDTSSSPETQYVCNGALGTWNLLGIGGGASPNISGLSNLAGVTSAGAVLTVVVAGVNYA